MSSHKRRRKAQERLPIFGAREQIVERVTASPFTLIMGETGCGKSTQVPQFLLEASKGEDTIVLCQPRRIAATSLAARISEEVGCSLGSLVGYKVRFDSCRSRRTRVLVMTTGMLLREAAVDPTLAAYKYVLLDEVHERSTDSDLLLGLLRGVQRERPEFRLVLMSATVDPSLYETFLGSLDVLYIKGRQFPVTTYYASSPVNDYVSGALFTVLQVHKKAPIDQHILVFLTGQSDCTSLVSLLTKEKEQLVALPLYSSLTAAEQRRAFAPPPRGFRKVVVATNVAESSLTIPRIGHVVDCGKHKERVWNAARHLSSLQVHDVARASARQRAGRAGREFSGSCYRLYTENHFWNTLEETPVAELLRCNLAAAMLQLMVSGVDNPISWDGYMEKPPLASLSAAIEDLAHLGAVHLRPKLAVTPLGKQMSAFPMDPHLARCVLAARDNGVLPGVLLVCAMLVTDMPFVNPENKRKQAVKAREPFGSRWGDHLRLRNVLRAYLATEEHARSKWAAEHFLRPQAMVFAQRVYDQLWDYCISALGESKPAPGVQELEDETVDALILKSLLVGYFSHVGVLSSAHTDGRYRLAGAAGEAWVHPTSSVYSTTSYSRYVLYTELVYTTKLYLRGVSRIDSKMLPKALWK